MFRKIHMMRLTSASHGAPRATPGSSPPTVLWTICAAPGLCREQRERENMNKMSSKTNTNNNNNNKTRQDLQFPSTSENIDWSKGKNDEFPFGILSLWCEC